jgi:hypothetical protein
LWPGWPRRRRDVADSNRVASLAKVRARRGRQARAPAAAPDWLARLNARHAVVRLGSRTVILDERGHEPPAFLKPDDFHLWYANDRVPAGPRDVPVSYLWLKHHDRRQYERVVFEPGRDAGPGCYNLWRDFAVGPDPTKSCGLFLAHIRDNVCSGNEQHYAWVLGFLAHTVQRPWEKAGVALVLRGDEGTGKGFLANHVGALFPHHYVVISHAEHITGRFNAHHQQALLMFVDEAFWAGDKKAEGVLKHLVTDETVTTELKHLDPITTRNVSRFIIASNEDWVVPAGLKARRWAVLDVADTRKEDRAYFAAIEEEWEGGGKAALLHLLLNFDLSSVDLYRVPKTSGLLHQKIESMQPHERWWLECLFEGGISIETDDVWEKWRVDSTLTSYDAAVAEIEKKKLHGSYRHWCSKHNVRARLMDVRTLHRWLKPLLPGMTESRPGSGKERTRFIGMPSLNAARHAFAERLGQSVEWEEGMKEEESEAERAGEGRTSAAPSRPVEPDAKPPRSFSELRRRKDYRPDFTGLT